MVLLGTLLDTGKAPEIGFIPPLSDGAKLLTNRSLKGTFIGRSTVPEADDIPLSLPQLNQTWVRSTLIPLHNHLKDKPIIMTWDEDNYANEAALCWVEQLPKKPRYSKGSFMTYDLNLKATVS